MFKTFLQLKLTQVSYMLWGSNFLRVGLKIQKKHFTIQSLCASRAHSQINVTNVEPNVKFKPFHLLH